MSKKPTYEELEQRVKELEKEAVERKRPEEALRDSEHRYRTLFNNIPVGIGVSTPDGRVLAANDAMLQMFGYREADLNQIYLTDLYQNPEDRDMIIKQLKTEGFVRSFDMQFIRKDGTPFYGSITVTPFPMENVDTLLTVMVDVTQRKQVEEALQESEEKYRELVEGTDDLITRVDKDGKFIFVNYMSYKVLGLAPKDCVGKTAFDFIYPDDKERTRKWFDDVIAMHRTSGTLENRQVNQNGEIHYMLWTSNFLYDPYGNLIGVNGIARDITKKKQTEEALRKSEERFRNVYDTAPLAFVVWDINTHVTDWNKKAKELFGWTKEEVIGNNFFDFLIPEKYRPHVEDVVDSLMKGELLSHSINDNLTKEGKIITCVWNNSALHDTDGNIIGAISLGLV